MSSGSSSTKDLSIEYIYQAEIESSEEPPSNEWSSLDMKTLEEHMTRNIYNKSCYVRGSDEICAEYVCLSASSILRHPYYHYPSISDPGIKRALLNPEEKLKYPDDGQEMYLSLCKEMNQCPIRPFHRDLLEEEINLRYYCVNPNGIRAMCLALKYNRLVKVLDLTDNFMNNDSCYHFGDMFISNSSLRVLILSGCRIGHEGVKLLLSGLHFNRSLVELNLNGNQLGDIGMENIAQSVLLGLGVQKLHLRNNNIGAKGIIAFTEALNTTNKFVHLDLSWNNLYVPATYQLLNTLGGSTTLQECNLSWNSLSTPRIGLGIKGLTKAPKLRSLNLSNNKLAGEAIVNLLENLGKAKHLATLDLSNNPLSPNDALMIITKLKQPTVKIQRLILDNVFVNTKFLEILEEIRDMKSKRNTLITYGGVIGTFKPQNPDMRDLVLNRAEFLTKRPKKNRVDIALVVLQLLKDNKLTMSLKEFITYINNSGAPLDEDLLIEISRAFPGPSSSKTKTIDIKALADYVKMKWPERKLPPTPPPEPDPEPILEEPKGKNEKGKKDKGKK